MAMNEQFPTSNHSDILRQDERTLYGDSDDDTAPIPIDEKPYVRSFVAESAFDTANTDVLSKNAVRQALGLRALHTMTGQERQDEINSLLGAPAPNTTNTMHIDGRIPGQTPTRDAREDVRRNAKPSPLVAILNQQRNR